MVVFELGNEFDPFRRRSVREICGVKEDQTSASVSQRMRVRILTEFKVKRSNTIPRAGFMILNRLPCIPASKVVYRFTLWVFDIAPFKHRLAEELP